MCAFQLNISDITKQVLHLEEEECLTLLLEVRTNKKIRRFEQNVVIRQNENKWRSIKWTTDINDLQSQEMKMFKNENNIFLSKRK